MDSDGILEHEYRRDRVIQAHPRARAAEAERMPPPADGEVDPFHVVAAALQQSHSREVNNDTATITSVSTTSVLLSMFEEDYASHDHPPTMSARVHPTTLPNLQESHNKNQAFEKRIRSSANSVCSQEPQTQRPRKGGSIMGDNVGAAADSTINQKTDDPADAGEDSESQMTIMCESIASISVDGSDTRSFKSKRRQRQLTYESTNTARTSRET